MMRTQQNTHGETIQVTVQDLLEAFGPDSTATVLREIERTGSYEFIVVAGFFPLRFVLVLEMEID